MSFLCYLEKQCRKDKGNPEKLFEPHFSDLTVVDFSDLAQDCKTYDEFIEKMNGVSESDLNNLHTHYISVNAEYGEK